MSLGVLSYTISLEVAQCSRRCTFPKTWSLINPQQIISPCQTSIFRFSCFNRWPHCTLWRRLFFLQTITYCLLIVKSWICLVLSGGRMFLKHQNLQREEIFDRHGKLSASFSLDHSPSLKVISVSKSNHTFTVTVAEQKMLLSLEQRVHDRVFCLLFLKMLPVVFPCRHMGAGTWSFQNAALPSIIM